MSSRSLEEEQPVTQPTEHPEYGDLRVPNIRLVGPRLLVLPKPKREKTLESGLIIPEHAQENVQEGVVLIVGDGLLIEGAPWAAPAKKTTGLTVTSGMDHDMTGARPLRLPPSVEPGDCIIYARYAGIELELGDAKYLIISESDVRAVLTYKGKAFEFAPE